MKPLSRSLGVFFAAALVGCDAPEEVTLRPSDATPPTDGASAPTTDTLPGPPDVAPNPAIDARPAADVAESEAVDAGPGPVDSAPPTADAAPPPSDAAPAPSDAAPPIADAFVHTPADAADAAPTIAERLAACDSDPLLAGRLVIDESGWGHVPEGTEVAYGNNPPASGPHYNQWVRSGVYAAPIERRNWVHNLEHGWLVLLHRPDAPQAQIAALAAAYAQGFDDAQCPNGPVARVVVTPDPLLPTPVAAVTAFRALTADSLDRPTLEAMFARCREAAPERAVCADGRVPAAPSAPP